MHDREFAQLVQRCLMVDNFGGHPSHYKHELPHLFHNDIGLPWSLQRTSTTIPLTDTTHDSQHKKKLQAHKGTFMGFRDLQATLWTSLSKLWHSVHTQEKSTKTYKSQTPHILQMVIDYEIFFAPSCLKPLKMGG
jgi:hypothetical protein